ncbi:hypothetical protein LAZ67_3004912 [Cordylochernes scorpioides]|uniref:Peptidase A2 domain-containing protein n=1 Tax=Cordylochernes scorpioides TaxID=51811 RepID=A0ABY6KAN4_9ARAC|nr:hypothetical protein LAZ67_3004912 [Cordylochernes scorpioides]
MEILKRHRNVLRKRLTRCLKTTEEFLSGTPPIPVEDIEYNREIIEETHSELLVIQGKIRLHANFRHRIKEVYRRNKRLVGWWAQFNKIHVDPTLEDSDKFQYLVQSMSPEPELVNWLIVTPDCRELPQSYRNFDRKFGRPELLQQVYVRDLIRLMIDCSSKQQLKKLMKAWQRSPLHDVKIDANDSTQTRVELIMEFLQKEAAAEQDRALAGSKFGLRSLKQDRNVAKQSHPVKIPTLWTICWTCPELHLLSTLIFYALLMLLDESQRMKSRNRWKTVTFSSTVENGVSFSGLSASSLILLQTLKIKVEGATSAKVVRALLDTGSQRSYILSKTAQDLGISPIGQNHLNMWCLEVILMIPNLMLRFRNGKFGVVADIKKAFLQFEVNERDRDYLRFLWYSQNGEKTEVFRHRRVVFGVNSQRLQKSFYVDNLVTSVNSFEGLQDLKLTATSIMDNARLELSRWEHSLDVASDTYPFERAEISKVLGICWDKSKDCLSCEIPVAIPPKITKRSILSCLAQIYDPIGFLSPILIKPKILLQKAWTLKLAWDDELDRHYKDELSLWFLDLQLHKGMAIPRNFNPLMVPQKDWQIHTFVDASSEAYAAVVFLRTRVGTRLNKMIFEALELKDIKNVFWSDATTALAWIKRDDQWGTFVGNRVKEICRLSDPGNWRYVPSECNPADLPSRGCSLSRLIQSTWWEGPSWLKLSEEFWPSRYKDLNEEEICAERKKTAVVTTKIHLQPPISTKVKGELSVKEIDEAELALLKLVQAECFPSHSIPGLNVCEVEGILRVKTKSSTAASSRLLNNRKEKTAKLQTRSEETFRRILEVRFIVHRLFLDSVGLCGGPRSGLYNSSPPRPRDLGLRGSRTISGVKSGGHGCSGLRGSKANLRGQNWRSGMLWLVREQGKSPGSKVEVMDALACEGARQISGVKMEDEHIIQLIMSKYDIQHKARNAKDLTSSTKPVA